MDAAVFSSPFNPLFQRTVNEVLGTKFDSMAESLPGSSLRIVSHNRGRRNHLVSSALPENSPSLFFAAIAVGAAAVILAKRTTPDATDISTRTCEDCGGSGLCSECNGEGFILKKLSTESADKARSAAKNMATRYTAGLPKKWYYCTKCSSSRSCRTCGGSGRLS